MPCCQIEIYSWVGMKTAAGRVQFAAWHPRRIFFKKQAEAGQLHVLAPSLYKDQPLLLIKRVLEPFAKHSVLWKAKKSRVTWFHTDFYLVTLPGSNSQKNFACIVCRKCLFRHVPELSSSLSVPRMVRKSLLAPSTLIIFFGSSVCR